MATCCHVGLSTRGPKLFATALSNRLCFGCFLLDSTPKPWIAENSEKVLGGGGDAVTWALFGRHGRLMLIGVSLYYPSDQSRFPV